MQIDFPRADDPFSIGAARSTKRTAHTSHDQLWLDRLTCPAPPEGNIVGMPSEDAYMVALQLRDRCAHDFWVDGRYQPAPQTAQGCIHIADLAARPVARLEGPVDCLLLKIPRQALIDLSEACGSAPAGSLCAPVPWTTHDKILEALAPSLAHAISAQGSVADLFLEHMILAATIHVAESYGDFRPRQKTTCGLAPWQIRRAKEMLLESLETRLPLWQIAQACDLTTAHFGRAFKAAVGSPPHGWLKAQRTEQARRLLRDSRVSLTEITRRCGYADRSHFAKVFARAVGISPTAYRRLHGGRPEGPTH